MASQIASATSLLVEERRAPSSRSVWAAAPFMFAAIAMGGTPAAAAPVDHSLVVETPKPRDWITTGTTVVANLDHNWDGYGADPISASTVSTMEFLLRHLLPDDAVPGSIVPGADGSLQAEWHLEKVELGLIVEADGEVSTWVRPVGSEQETEAHGIPARTLFWSVAHSALV